MAAQEIRVPDIGDFTDVPIIEILVADARRVLPHLITAAEEKADVKGVDVIEPNLESVFLHLTGRALRDAAE